MSFFGNLLKKTKGTIQRNDYNILYQPAEPNRVNIEHSAVDNVGDHLGPVIADWVLSARGIDAGRTISRTRHLMTIGSIIGRGMFDCTIWGSGILKEENRDRIAKLRRRYRRKMDIRAVRGPVTRDLILSAGYDCPEVYGDPAVLLPLIYQPAPCEKVYETTVILHHRTKKTTAQNDSGEAYVMEIGEKLIERCHLHFLDPATADWKAFVDELVRSKRVISSSLHGIILAEAYGIPTVFLNWGMDDQQIKFRDWYLSTGRELQCAKSLEEAVEAPSAPLPQLDGMRQNLIDCFPYDLWEVSEA